MTDWQIIESDNFPDYAPDGREPYRPRSRWRWVLLAAGILVFLAGAGFVTLRGRQHQGRLEYIRSDPE